MKKPRKKSIKNPRCTSCRAYFVPAHYKILRCEDCRAEARRLTNRRTKARLKRLEDLADRPLLETRAKLRSCLCCSNQFMSQGAHNRMCDYCRERSRNYGMDIPGSTGRQVGVRV